MIMINYKLPKYGRALREIEEGIIEKIREQIHYETTGETRALLVKDPEAVRRLRGVDERLVDEWIWLKKTIGEYSSMTREEPEEIPKAEDVDRATPKELLIMKEKTSVNGKMRITKGGYLSADSSLYLPSIWTPLIRLWDWIKKRKEKVGPKEFFKRMKREMKETKDHKGAAYFLIMREEALEIQQEGRATKCLEDMFVDRYEEILRREGITKYLEKGWFKKIKTKDVVVQEINEYKERIPLGARERIKDLNELYIFDNYYIVKGDREIVLFGTYGEKWYQVKEWKE